MKERLTLSYTSIRVSPTLVDEEPTSECWMTSLPQCGGWRASLSVEGDEEVATAHDEGGPCSWPRQDLPRLSPSSQHAADQPSVLLRVAATSTTQIMIRTVNKDVLVMKIAACHHLYTDELWIAFGTGNHYRYQGAHQYAIAFGANKSGTLALFHAITGWDRVFSFAGRGKRVAWAMSTSYTEASAASTKFWLRSKMFQKMVLTR